MRLLFLNRCYGADSEATGQLLAELCGDLARSHQVSVVAGPRPGSAGLLRREVVEGVEVVRTWGTRLAKTSLVGRLLNLGTYFALAPLAALWVGRVDVVIAETDPPLLGLLGALLKRLWRCRFVYYCQDLYPDVAEALGGIRSRPLLRMLSGANGIAYAAADRIIAVGEDMRARLEAKGVVSDRLEVIPNWIDATVVRPCGGGALRAQIGDRFVVMYSGNLGLSQPLEVVLRAAERLRDDPRIVFALIGDGARRPMLQSWARRARLDNVFFKPMQPKAQLAESLGAADIHLVPLRRGLSGCLVPSKVYGILAVGKPLIALMEKEAEVARMVAQHDVGFVVAPEDVEGLIETIGVAESNRERLAEMGGRARRLAEEQCDRATAVARFARMIGEAQMRPSLRFSGVSR